MGLAEIVPKCSSCFWFKILWDEDKCVCEHPQHQGEVSIDEAMERAVLCGGKDWVEKGDSAFEKVT